ncbi:tetratricopeptide repeat protein [Pseudobacteroides cellulosolvens]|uniref:Tetratricopeptide TPR_2 repeat-containing protein n=1 Tax=Pseudobacteroides cellulosolvens ATCC 35603 = DSM 2933 TaxID=398512 RepID=A0A0L6JR96_9FIRM|nr:hypothetical protein [Pseudobacteroides cellulosolvens]KNY28309.1 Tetratricopeptide TPR_2 repeat-containing protein [Pseudobacteroides cellulosolvens ATCC 35603 = DSM 2933]
MKSFDEIIEIIDAKEYDNAEKELDILISSLSGKELIRAYYIKAYINDEFRYDEVSRRKAKQYYGYVIESDYPKDYAYYRLAIFERDKQISVSMLKKALKLFPQSICCYKYLLTCSEKDEKDSVYDEICKKNLFDWDIQEQMFTLCFEEEKYEKAIEVYLRNDFSKMDDNTYKYAWDLAYAFSIMLTGNKSYNDKSKGILDSLVEHDIKNSLGYKHFLGLCYWYLCEENKLEAIKCFEKIPSGYVLENYPPFPSGLFPLSFTIVFEKIFSKLIEIAKGNRQLLVKAKGLRVLFLHSAKEFEEDIKLGMSEVKDIESAIKYFPNDKVFYQVICSVLTEKRSYLKVFEYHFKLLSTFYTIDEDDTVDASYICDCGDDAFKDMVDFLKTKLHENECFIHNVCSGLVPAIVERLWKSDKYKEIVEISSLFPISEIEKTESVFEIAFSYAEEKQNKIAKRLYELLVNKTETGSGVYNNLSLIYEGEGNIEKSYELLNKALEKEPNDEIAKGNFDRVKKKVNDENKRKSIYNEAFKNFQNEGIFVKQKLLDFSQKRDENNYIVCSYRQLPIYMKMNENQAKSLLDDFLEKSYILKVTKHNYDTKSNVYTINPKILNYIPELDNTIKDDLELLEMSKVLSTENLSSIGYNSDLIKCLDKIKTPELSVMLKRDIKENALACLLGQNKASIILSGSILEAILLDKIKSVNIDKAQVENGKTKKVIDMDLNELLYVAKQNDLIKLEIYHFSNAVRIYRNLIHPGVEIKKLINGVSSENAELMWDILKRVLIDI